ncbi:MAG: hypothetical protein KAJ03_08035 [Gammaproteobacteria bacterium]|nr:hypothetical protein [Gammaproteobacteria bacterium]
MSEIILQMGSIVPIIVIGVGVTLALYLYLKLSIIGMRRIGLVLDFLLNSIIAIGCVAFVARYPVVFAITALEAAANQIMQIYAYGYIWDTRLVMIIVCILSLVMLRVFIHCVHRLNEIVVMLGDEDESR